MVGCERVFGIRYWCDICSYNYCVETDRELIGHEFKNSWSNDDQYHWLDAICGHDVIDKKGLHSGGTATCKEQAICEVCKASYGDLLDHKFIDYIYNKKRFLTILLFKTIMKMKAIPKMKKGEK